MRATHCTESDLYAALETINRERYGGNIEIKELRPDGAGIRFRLFARGFDKPGYRRGFARYDYRTGALVHEGRRMRNACWHAHGHFFDALLAIAPDARVRAGDLTITATGGNWTDRNIGSQMYPLYFSEACDCDRDHEADDYAAPGVSARGGF